MPPKAFVRVPGFMRQLARPSVRSTISAQSRVTATGGKPWFRRVSAQTLDGGASAAAIAACLIHRHADLYRVIQAAAVCLHGDRAALGLRNGLLLADGVAATTAAGNCAQ